MKRKIMLVMGIYATTWLAWAVMSGAPPHNVVVTDASIYNRSHEQSRKEILFAQQDVIRATKAIFVARQGSISHREKQTAILGRDRLVYPDAKVKPAFVKLCQEAVQLAQQRLLKAQNSSLVPDFRSPLADGDIGELNGEAVVHTILNDGRAVIIGKFARPARTVNAPRPVLPSDWTKAKSAEELLDMGDGVPGEQPVLLSGSSTNDFQAGKTASLRKIGVVVEGMQVVDLPTGKIPVPVLREINLYKAVNEYAQEIESERKRKEAEKERDLAKGERKREKEFGRKYGGKYGEK